MKKAVLSTLIVLLIFTSFVKASEIMPTNNTACEDTVKACSDNKLVVVWTSADKEVALKMVFMYTFNAKKFKWWDDITLLVWGPSSKLLSEDKELQDYVKKMKEKGIKILACKGCADQYGVSEKLKEIGVKVKYTGVDFTNFIKERHVVTF